MKALLILPLLAAIRYAYGMSDEMKEMAKMVHDQCIEETGASDQVIQDTTKGAFPDDQKLKCYLKCIYSNMGAITDEGTLDADAFMSILPDDMQYLLPVINTCKGITGADGCETAFNFNVCMYKTDSSKYLII
uniref:Odorant-binding protein 1 n=1 Tax=Yemma signatus TaxID=300820 RepID=A0A3G2GRT7_9HEMI|nr:odorant-binding protein 1 [Yemma signatus]